MDLSSCIEKNKTISSDSKSDYFMGSDFTYDDLGNRQPSQDAHAILRKEKLNDDERNVEKDE